MDVAIQGDGFFLVKNEDSSGLSRRGDFNISGEGFLVNGAGEQVLSSGLEPIAVAPHKNISISEDGTIIVEPLGGEPGTTQNVGMLATTMATGEKIGIELNTTTAVSTYAVKNGVNTAQPGAN